MWTIWNPLCNLWKVRPTYTGMNIPLKLKHFLFGFDILLHYLPTVHLALSGHMGLVWWHCCCCYTELKSAVGQIISTERSVLAVEQNKVLVPPTYNKYLAWGFSDLSVRIGNYESDKVSFTCGVWLCLTDNSSTSQLTSQKAICNCPCHWTWHWSFIRINVVMFCF